MADNPAIKRHGAWIKKEARKRDRGPREMKKVVKRVVKDALTRGDLVEHKRQRGLFNSGLALVANTLTISNTLNAVTVGTGDLSNRIGDKVRMTDLNMHGYFQWTGAGYNHIRFIVLIWYMDIASSVPTDSILYDDTGSAPTKIWGPMNRDASLPKNKRYRVLTDKVISLSSENPLYRIKMKRKLNNTVQGVSGQSFSNAGVGIPYICVISDSANASFVYWEARYTDI